VLLFCTSVFRDEDTLESLGLNTGAMLYFKAVFRIRIHVFFGLPDPDPLVRGMDPDPALDPDLSIIMQK
jgi:hypothetical protein